MAFSKAKTIANAATEKGTLWKVTHNSKLQFFNRLAHEQGFHPEKEFERWYTVRSQDFFDYKVCILPRGAQTVVGMDFH